MPSDDDEPAVVPRAAPLGPLITVIENYYGENKPPTIESFLQQLEEVSKLGGWSEKSKVAIARIRMKGDAAEFMNANPHLRKLENWKTFKSALLTRFARQEPLAHKLQRFHECIQKSSETVNEYVTRLKLAGNRTLKVTEDREENDMRAQLLEETMQAQFIRGLRQNIRRFVMSRNPASFDEAVTVAINEELNEMQSQERKHSVYMVDADKQRSAPIQTRANIPAQMRPRDQVEGLPRTENRTGDQRRGSDWREKPASYNTRRVQWEKPGSDDRDRQALQTSRQRRCYRCNEVGHLVRDCHLPPPQDRRYEHDGIKCYNCQAPGHKSPQCPQGKTNPENKRSFSNVLQFGKSQQ